MCTSAMTKSGLTSGSRASASSPLLTARTSKSSSMNVSSMTFWMVTLSSASRILLFIPPPSISRPNVAPRNRAVKPFSPRGLCPSGRETGLKVFDDGLRGGPRQENRVDTGGLQGLDVLLRNDASGEDQDVLGALFLEQPGHLRQQRVVSARQNGQPHRVHVLLDGGGRDLLGRLPQTGVNHLIPSVA